MVAGPGSGIARLGSQPAYRPGRPCGSPAPLKTPSLAAVLPTSASWRTPRAIRSRRPREIVGSRRFRLRFGPACTGTPPRAVGRRGAACALGAAPRYAYFPLQGVSPGGQHVGWADAQVGLVTADSAVAFPGSIPSGGLPFALLAPVPGEALRIRVESLALALAGTAVRERTRT